MMKYFSLCLIALFISTPSFSLEKLNPNQPLPANLFVKLAEAVNPTVVNISTATKIKQRRRYNQDPFFDLFDQMLNGGHQGYESRRPPQQGLGTGFIIRKDGLIITNNHVIENADIINVQLSGSPKKFEAIVIGKDSRTDIALIKIKTPYDLPTIKLGTSANLKPGEWVAAFGNPFGHTHSMSKGIISAIGRQINELNRFPFIQTDASINPGNSGGPLVNTGGEVIGVNTAIDARAQGIGFAIPIDNVKAIIKQLEKDGGIQRGFLGVALQDVSNRGAVELELPNSNGSLITKVSPASPASKAGLKNYDFIIKFNGKKVKSTGDLINQVGDTSAKQKVKVVVIRNGRKKTLSVKLGAHPDSQKVKRNTRRSYSGQKAPYQLGFHLQDYSQKLMSRFNLAPLQKGRPVIIEVKPGTPASESGLYPGDIILDLNRKPVYKTKEVLRKLKKDKINILKILRGSEISLVYLSSKN